MGNKISLDKCRCFEGRGGTKLEFSQLIIARRIYE